MTRYQDLARKAAAWSNRYYDNLGECRHLAQLIAVRYLEHLEAPLGAVQFIGLTSTLGFESGATKSLSELPSMVRGLRGEQYFGMVTKFEGDGPHGALDRALIGLRKGANAWEINWHAKKFRVPFEDLAKLEGLFVEVEKDALRGFDTEASSASHQIGFVPLERSREHSQ